MRAFFENSSYFAVLLCLVSFGIGLWVRKKVPLPLCNPLLVAIIITITVVLVGKIDHTVFTEKSSGLVYLLTPATICLAVPLYEQFGTLKKNAVAVMSGIFAGALMSLLTIWGLSHILHLDHVSYVSFLPKSITTAIGIGVSEELGGNVSVTVLAIFITGLSGNIVGEALFTLLHIDHPIAKGVGLGTAAHAIGTAKALELGEVEGALSGLSLVVAAIFTVVLAPFFVNLL